MLDIAANSPLMSTRTVEGVMESAERDASGGRAGTVHVKMASTAVPFELLSPFHRFLRHSFADAVTDEGPSCFG